MVNMVNILFFLDFIHNVVQGFIHLLQGVIAGEIADYLGIPDPALGHIGLLDVVHGNDHAENDQQDND